MEREPWRKSLRYLQDAARSPDVVPGTGALTEDMLRGNDGIAREEIAALRY